LKTGRRSPSGRETGSYKGVFRQKKRRSERNKEVCRKRLENNNNRDVCEMKNITGFNEKGTRSCGKVWTVL